MEDARSSEPFMTSGGLSSAVNPAIFIPKVGPIRLPISTDDAKAISHFCRQSPYDEGIEPLGEESVRKSWQLDADQFVLQKPQWQVQLGRFVKKAIAGLGLPASSQEVKADLYKLLIDEEGAFSPPHPDSEKADGMFATLAVCLPSKHEGGDLIAFHKNARLEFQTAPTSEFGFSWAAWYADVTHELKPVASGYRVVLVYNLIHHPSAALLNSKASQADKLAHLLVPWARPADEDAIRYLDGWDTDPYDMYPPALVYLLENQYTSAKLGISQLAGTDESRFMQLRNACERAGLEIFLANVEKKDTGEVHNDKCEDGDWSWRDNGTHEFIELMRSSLEFSQVVDLEGNVIGEHLPFPERMLVQADTFNRDPDYEDYDDFGSSETAEATHFYRATGALIIPAGFHFMLDLQQLKHGQRDAGKFLEDCHRVVLERPNDKLAKLRLLHVCRVIFPARRDDSRCYAAAKLRDRRSWQEKVMQIAVELAEPALYCRVLVARKGDISPAQVAQAARFISEHSIDAVRSS
ncbi:uncharacterized protein BO80DRAFT_88583 [Aspergillus ibericus CBS 121593]|uniref:Prolyl 4-hydroxylase alpha subunit Fe(2+) 2OG dioxygenase domain-containing protein n=1 Tax=Aspergillus ibericus CBS 121593 TaxID=1448316 RepID=A0A395H3N4_9EURO|nr:hypothetical protein BO80DRAFT_88583 [Aspergillus ibericus CBS 121593]RAL00834.1 hypothetical protein BO80DRAFT_88583 [Aspergillus ibericus CBS 121593]